MPGARVLTRREGVTLDKHQLHRFCDASMGQVAATPRQRPRANLPPHAHMVRFSRLGRG